LNIKKCEFEVKSTKYLSFIINTERGLCMDPQKIEAITNWKAPTSVKGVHSLLGFADFYRRFIQNFANIAAPLTRLTGDITWRWTQQEQEAFDKLKAVFVSEPVLAHFHPDREILVETDSSGYAVGGVLSQYDDKGILRPCAYFSRKNNPHECNYKIHDKEMLAIIRYLEKWDSELRTVEKFTVLTDHKNLEYFTKPRRLNKRQTRWSILLGRYNITLQYRPGKLNERADALLRREQDLPANAEDARLKHRYWQLLKPTTAAEEEVEDSTDAVITFSSIISPLKAFSAQIEPMEPAALEELWKQAIEEDTVYLTALQCVKGGERRFPTYLELKASIAECYADGNSVLHFRNRKWVPNSEPLRTRLIYKIHASLATGHPGREGRNIQDTGKRLLLAWHV
jgi:hypothetical protein